MKRIYLLITFIISVLFAGCGEQKETLLIYTPHGDEMLKRFTDKFIAENPGIDVQAFDIGSQAIYDRIRSERSNPQADLWWGAPATIFMNAAKEGLLEPYKPSWADAVSPANRDKDDLWYGTFLTPEVIGYNSEKLTAETAPQDWDDLLKPEWKGRIVIRNPMASGTMRAIFISRILKDYGQSGNTDAGYDWLRKLDANTRSYTASSALMYVALTRSESDVTLWNMPDMILQKKENNRPFDFVIPASGTVVLTDCIAVVAGAKHPVLARKFYEFVTSEKALIEQAHDFYRIPARTDIPKAKLPEWMQRDIKTMPIDWQLFADKSAEWMKYWEDNIRDQGK